MFGALLRTDSFICYDPAGGADAEGRPNRGYKPGRACRGTWGSATSTDIELAGRMSIQITAVVATEEKLEKDAKLTGLRGSTWIVTHRRDVRTHYRTFLVERPNG